MEKVRSNNQTLTRGLSHEFEIGKTENSHLTRESIKNSIQAIDDRFELQSEYYNVGEITLDVDRHTYFNTNEINEKWNQVIDYLHVNKFSPSYRQGVHQSGHHIHYDVSHLSPVQISNIIVNFWNYQAIILLAVPKSRYQNHPHINLLNDREVREVYEDAKRWKKGLLSRQAFIEGLSSYSRKFKLISTYRLQTFGTLELRMFGLPLVSSLEESKERFFMNGQFLVNLCEYFARFKGLTKLSKNSPRLMLSTEENERMEKSKPNRYSKARYKNFFFGFEQIFRNAMESERTYNHFKKRIFNVLPYRDDIEDMQTIRDYIHNHKF